MTRQALLVLVALAAAVGGATIHGGALRPNCVEAASTYQVALVIEHSDGEPGIRRCISAAGTSGVAADILDASGVRYRYVDEGAYGRAICQVQNEPPGTNFDRNNCLSGDRTWSIFCSSPWRHLPDGSDNPCYTSDGSWRYSSHGISSLEVRGGDALGFKYEGNPDRPGSPSGICPAVAGDRPPSPAPSPPPAAPPPAPTGGNSGHPAPGLNGTAGKLTQPSSAQEAPTPGLAAGGGETPSQVPQASGLTAQSTTPPPTGIERAPAIRASSPSMTNTWLGRVAAAVATVLLVAGVAIQVVLPRLRG